jgi:radical SAM superfamily enzyme YgiQ (UPF0313 family)
MKVLLISMPDVIPILIHETALHMPNHGIACLGGNIDPEHQVFLVDLVRKRGRSAAYLTKTLRRLDPDLVGLSAMTWQYPTCLALIGLIGRVAPRAKIAVGGYHATVMSEEVAASPEGQGIDFIVRGEGEETFRRLVNALAGAESLAAIPSLSFRGADGWVHNPRGDLCDLSRLRLPIRDRRRLTGGYHFMYYRIEVMETSRGCTRRCNFCSINHMYGRSYRTYPIERILADLDDIYHNRRTRLIFVADDNMVLNPKWVMSLCEAIVARAYRGLNLIVQADCLSIANNEPMIGAMAAAGFRVIFLGIENVSRRNLQTMEKGDIVAAARRAVALCHKHGMMVIGGLIFGLPGDDTEAIRLNYAFLKELETDAAYCQILTPYPKTRLRKTLMAESLVTNPDRYEFYNGLWANVRTHHLSAGSLQYAFWHQRQTAMGWWTPSAFAIRQGRLWTDFWTRGVKPVMKYFLKRKTRRVGWEGRYRQEIGRLAAMNRFADLDSFRPGPAPPPDLPFSLAAKGEGPGGK